MSNAKKELALSQQKRPAPNGTGLKPSLEGIRVALSDRRRIKGTETLFGPLSLKGDRLSVLQVVTDGATGYVAHVKKHVLAPFLGLDEAVSLLAVKPLNRSALHSVFVVVFVDALLRCNAGEKVLQRDEAAMETQFVMKLYFSPFCLLHSSNFARSTALLHGVRFSVQSIERGQGPVNTVRRWEWQ